MLLSCSLPRMGWCSQVQAFVQFTEGCKRVGFPLSGFESSLKLQGDSVVEKMPIVQAATPHHEYRQTDSPACHTNELALSVAMSSRC